MRRGGPLRRTDRLRRATAPLRRHRRLAPRSAKMRDVYERPGGRRDIVAQILADRPWCEGKVPGVCTGRSQDVHEKATRARGGSILDEANLLALCRMCNGWAADNPLEAEAMGLVSWSWDRGSPGAVG